MASLGSPCGGSTGHRNLQGLHYGPDLVDCYKDFFFMGILLHRQWTIPVAPDKP